SMGYTTSYWRKERWSRRAADMLTSYELCWNPSLGTWDVKNKRLIQRTSSSGPRIQDVVDLPKMVQVVCGFQADELLDRLPSAYLVDPMALHPPCARDRLQQSQVALAQRPKDHCRKARILLRVTQALRPYGLIPPR